MIETVAAPGWGIFDIPIEKPSWDEAPEWANWIAQNATGFWHFYDEEPFLAYDCWYSPKRSEVHVLQFTAIPNAYWHKTLEKRPVVANRWAEVLTDNHKEAEMLNDMVNEPPHYTKGEIECIEVLEQLSDDGHDFRILNAMKYLWRYRHKGGKESLRKSIWYIERYLDE